MSWFKKESKTHFIRDDVGKVIEVKREGDQPKEKGVYKALMKQYYEEHPEKTKKAKLKRGAIAVGKRIDKWAVDYNRRQGGKTSPPLGSYSFKNNYNPFGTMFDSGMTTPKRKKKKSAKKYAIIGGKAYPIAGTTRKKKKKSRKKSSSWDPFDNSKFWR